MLSVNQRKYLSSLQVKKYRQKYRNFLVEGDKIILELIAQSRVKVAGIYAVNEWLEQHAAALTEYASVCHAVLAHDIEKVSALTHPRGAIAVAEIPEPGPPLWNRSSLGLYLDGLQDPGNMGAVLRIADWFGLSGVWCSPDCVDAWSPKAIQSGMGACLRVPVFEDVELSVFARAHPEIAIIGADLDGKNVFESSIKGAALLVIGNEGHGIRPENQALLSEKLTIPAGKTGAAESLNAAVATGILVAALSNRQD